MLPSNPFDYEITHSVDYLPTTTLTVLTFFLVASLLYLKSAILFRKSSSETNKEKRISSIELSFQSIHPLLCELFQFGIILLYVWVCENRPIFTHGSKWHDIDFFYFLSFGLIAASLLTIKTNHKENDDLLNRDQTEEWKGWMQVMFLLYHYFHVGEVYNLIRVLISCYVWMTGFGNFSFFYIKQDFGFVRFYQMMWRLNFFVFFLCLTTNNLYMLYYICPLHTFYFLLTFVTMYCFPSINHTKYMIRWKVLIVGAIIFTIWEFEQVYNLVFFFLSDAPHPGYAVGKYGIKYEWHFRSGLDHYSTFFGMIFALNFPQVTLWLKQVESLSKTKEVLIKGIVGVTLFSMSYYYFTEIYILPKLEYNSYHPYVFIFPIVTYIFLRNSTFWLRSRRAVLLEKIGKVTLETYLLQHHIWLTSNAKTLLVFIPGYPKLNFLFVSMIYFVISQKMYRLTINLRARCIPDEKQNAINSAFIIVICFALFYSLCWVFQLFQISWYVYSLLIFVLSILTNSLIDFIFKSKRYLSNAKNQLVVSRTLGSSAIVLVIILVTLTSFNITKVSDDDIGPFRPAFSIFNEDVECLKHVNDFSFRNFDYAKLEKPQEMLIDETSVFRFNRLQSITNSKAKCKTYVYENSEAVAALTGKKILFVGNDAMKSFATSFVKEFSLGSASLGKFVTRNRNYIDYTNKEDDILISIARHPVKSRSNNFDVVVFDVSALDKETIAPANINYYYSNRTALNLKSSQYEPISKFIRENYAKGFIFVTPTKDSFNTNNISRLLAQEFLETKVGVVDLFRLKSFGRANFNEKVFHQIGTQLLLNNLDILFKYNEKLSHTGRVLSDISSSRKIGSGGGVAINPQYGFYILVLSAITMFSFDSYFGVAAFVKKVFDKKKIVTWEESVEDLHVKIGVKKSINNREKDVEAMNLLS